jgi:hypothetical protein
MSAAAQTPELGQPTDDQPPVRIGVAPFRKTPKQRELCRLMNRHEVVMAEGGARSGKTFAIIRQQIARGLMRPSRHLGFRYRAAHARASLLRDTIPKVFKLCFPTVPYQLNKSEMIFSFPSRGGVSEYWVAGTDDENRMDKVLGNEFADAFGNECSQIPFEAVLLIQSRLAQKTGLPIQLLLDQNPPAKTWWTYKAFHKQQTPDGEPLRWDAGLIHMNPVDNRRNLPPQYLRMLQSLPKRARQRYWEGVYLDDVEGALWTDSMVNAAHLRKPGEIVETCVAIDPSVSHRADSDECGLVVASRDHLRGGILHADASGKMSTETWARRAVALYREHKANVIVAEVNQGGDLIVDAIHHVDRNVRVVKVHASKSKYARAEPIAQLFEPGQERITFEQTFIDLEEELTTYVPKDASFSPNRLDAMVWAFTYLLNMGGAGDWNVDVV